jgi:hypothetical protein
VKELEATLMHPPILSTHVSMVQPSGIFQGTPELRLRLRGASNLLTATRHFVEENIKKKNVTHFKYMVFRKNVSLLSWLGYKIPRNI